MKDKQKIKHLKEVSIQNRRRFLDLEEKGKYKTIEEWKEYHFRRDYKIGSVTELNKRIKDLTFDKGEK